MLRWLPILLLLACQGSGESDSGPTVDTAEDFALMENIYGQFYKLDSIVDLKKVIPYLESHPEVARLNSKVVQKDWRIEE